MKRHPVFEQVLRGCRVIEAVVKNYESRQAGDTAGALPLEFDGQNPMEDLQELADFIAVLTGGGIRTVPIPGQLH